ncbi:MAG: aldo/keto reductase [Alphaproteobacteria bacterium HGW-Alphaproteobacteria-6]|nr:MAG: aldo/keto reductase [Alphaproteobacteria bacterium HGW-Alphaproteobacteria-6]
MQHVTLGRSGPSVSALCLGTMTWGNQTGEADAHAQIDLALDHGIDFIDTAEMYPVNPVRAETIGRTEEIIGRWIARGGRRDRWVLATKIAGKDGQARGGEPVSGAAIRRALEASLRRLGTDHVDLYQIHWPNRGSYHFRQWWSYDPSGRDWARIRDEMAECLATIAALVAEGRIRHWGLSNETAWGMAEWLRLAGAGIGPRPVSIQNEYSLLNRQYDTDLAELGAAEDVTLMAYSPLATGLLTGKYQGDVIPPGSRRSLNQTLSGRITPRVWGAIEACHRVAADAGIDPAQMAIAWVMARPFAAVPILGATTRAQLAHALGAAGLRLGADVQAALGAAHKANPMPY